MCGGCTRAVGHDRWSDRLSSTRARWQVAAAMNTVLRRTHHPARVTAVPGAWVVASATGRSTITDTATGLWVAVRRVGPIDPAAVETLHLGATTLEGRALAEAGAVV